MITKTEIPGRDGTQEVVTQTQGGIAKSGTTIYLSKNNTVPYTISCAINYDRN